MAGVHVEGGMVAESNTNLIEQAFIDGLLCQALCPALGIWR